MSNSTLALSFRIFQNGQLIREDTLTQGVIKIGKVPSAHLQITDDAVSRMHAIVEVTGKDVSLIDLGSTRGTFVNGKKINKATLQSGDTITLGDTRLELSIADAVPARRAQVTPLARVVVDQPAPPLPTMASDASPPASTPPAPIVRTTDEPAEPQIAVALAHAGWRSASLTAVAPPEAGARAVEVAAMLGDTVIGVKHCMDPRGGKRSVATWALLAGGAACLVAAAAAFALSVRTAADNKARFDTWTRVERKPAYAFRPVRPGAGSDWVALGGLALGLAGATLGIARIRRETASPYYRIGTAPGVELPLSGAPTAAFPLIAPSGDAFVFNYGAGIDGELIVDGASTRFAELAATGRARPSAAIAGAVEVPIPHNARIHARAGHASFVISAVAPPRRVAGSLLARLDGRVLAYVAGSLAAHLALWAILLALPPVESTINAEIAASEDLRIVGMVTVKDPPLPPDPTTGTGSGGSQGGAAPAMALPEGAAGTPDDKLDGRLQIRRRSDEPAQLSYADAIERARTDGILGSDAFRDGFQIAAATGDYTNAFDTVDVYGPLYGADGSGRGSFGGGVRGFSSGGGCGDEPCGTVGTGRYRTIGPGGPGNRTDFGPGGSHGVGWRPHGPAVPHMSEPETHGTYDKTIIRRHIRRQLDKIGYCYDKQLLAHPDLGGEITIRFFITPTGTVQAATGAGFDREVASCVADVIGNIAFPPPGEGGVQVSYPFQFHTSGR